MRVFSTISLILHFLLVSALVASSSTTPSAPTCPYRTVNYITHSLPQQCLTSSWKPSPTTSPNAGDSTTESTASATFSGEHLSKDDQAHRSSAQIQTQEVTPQISPTSNSPSQAQSTSSVKSTETPSAGGVDVAVDDVSPLEDSKFLSFEDWKRENLEKLGQSNNIGTRARGDHGGTKKRSNIDQNSLDALGDDAEIDIDFSGLVSDGLEPEGQPQPRPPQPVSDSVYGMDPGRAPKVGLRGKDAGTTSKERSNYASFDCGADHKNANPEAKNPKAILGENKDAYMLNVCSAKDKFIVFELCDDIAIDTIVVANFEFFSSSFRTFKVSVSDKYPIKIDKWKSLGIFEARNSREIQAFLIENSVIWARYVRIEFLTHYGNEFYCPLSLVRVHGATMLEEYKHDLESLQNEVDDEATMTQEQNVPLVDAEVSDIIAEVVLSENGSRSFKNTGKQDAVEVENSQTPSPSSTPESDIDTGSVIPPVYEPTSASNHSTFVGSLAQQSYATETCDLAEISSTTDPVQRDEMTESNVRGDLRSRTGESSSRSDSTTSIRSPTPRTASSNVTTSTSSSSKASSQATNSTSIKNTSTTPIVNNTKGSSSQTQAYPAVPTMQESFFKSVQKRLQMLESNSSLSLQYIEDQSRSLRDAFLKVEQRQLAKTTLFLDYLNNTVLNELREFRLQYDQLWQSTVIELELQRERYQRENLAINARLGVLADEVIFQKRMSTLQMILILVCLGFVLFSKGNVNRYLELPLLQNVLSRSPSTRWLNQSSIDTPTQSPPLTRVNSERSGKRQGILKGHRRLSSEDSIDGPISPADLYTPSTPVSFAETSDDEQGRADDERLGDPQFDPSLIERPSTSPPVLSGCDIPTTPPTPTSLPEAGDRTIESTLQSCTPDRRGLPLVFVEDATPPAKHLTWQLPDE
ncbi:hypothetical protein LTR84_002934 [Exophiala bonariae]|uniref:SUN domain-containing protein n=1 Tax=Exophiala bonariae TaxID=1690606 RepID=A0AAV9NBG3_9EURO|nr:hypothetical protein LTR84_002934 [Exophiala bonariae]